jgi:hypothetical protein
MAEANPKPNRYDLAAGDQEFIIYAKPSTLTPYVGSQVATASFAGANETVTVRSYSRRRYPGAPVSSVDSHARTSVRGGWRPDATLPGRSAWFEKTTGTGEGRTVQRDQFTFVGTTKALREWVEAEAVQAFVLRLPSGKSIAVQAVND